MPATSSCKRRALWPARYGGEEFALLLPDTDSAGALYAAKARGRNQVSSAA